MNHIAIRKGILYGGAFFLAIATFTVILANSSRFTAEVATQPLCVIDTETGLMPSNCSGSGGGTAIDTVKCIERAQPVVIGASATSATSANGCSCYNDPPFDTAFDSKTTGSFGSGRTALSNSVELSSLNQLLGVKTAAAQTGGNQLAESKNFESMLKTTINKAINEQKDKFKITVQFLKYPSSWFNDETHLEMFRTTFANELSSVLSDPTLTYDQQIHAAQKKVPQAFTKGMESFVYGKKDKHSESTPSDRSASRKAKMTYSPNWMEWTSVGFGSGTISLTFNDKTSGNNGSYTKCQLDLGVAGGSSRNFLSNASLKLTHGTFSATGRWSKPDEWSVSAQYSIRF